MKKKIKINGFLLAIIIIAILVLIFIIALPSLFAPRWSYLDESFSSRMKDVYKEAQQQWITDSMVSATSISYYSYNEGNSKGAISGDSILSGLDLSSKNKIDYYITLDKEGKVTNFFATDQKYQYYYIGSDLKIEEIGKGASLNNAIVETATLNGENYVCIGKKDTDDDMVPLYRIDASSSTSCYK